MPSSSELGSATQNPQLQSLTPRINLRDEVMENLRSSILTGGMTPGRVYSAPALATTFNVSATPVREAMAQLAAEGLVEVVPNKGFRVTEATEDDLNEMAQLRRYLEPPATADAAQFITPADLPRLRDLAEDIVVAARDSNLDDYMKADRVFHAAILTFGGNHRIVDLLTSLRSQTRLYGLRVLAEHGHLEMSAKEHHLILDAIEAQDHDLIVERVASHIGHSRGLWARKHPQPEAGDPPAVPDSAPSTGSAEI